MLPWGGIGSRGILRLVVTCGTGCGWRLDLLMDSPVEHMLVFFDKDFLIPALAPGGDLPHIFLL